MLPKMEKVKKIFHCKYIPIILIILSYFIFLIFVAFNFNEQLVITDNTTPEVSKNELSDGIRIQINNKGTSIEAVLDDNDMTRSLQLLLPITLTFEDFQMAEKIATLPEPLTMNDLKDGYDPVVGDIAYYAPWNNIVLFYEDQPYASGLYYLGKIDVRIEDIINIDAVASIKLKEE